MKTFLLLAALLSSFAYTNSQITNLASAVMHFDSTTAESLSGWIPTYPGGTAFTYVDDRLGNPNAAIQLNSTLNYGNPSFSQMGSSDFTIAFWFRKDGSLWSDRPIINKTYLSLSNPNNITTEHYTVMYNNWIGSGFMHHSFQPITDSSAIHGSIGYLPDSVWQHITLSYDRSDSLKTYLNGNWLQSIYIGNVVQYPANIDSANLEIGWGNMSLDDIYFFKSALSDTEVLELYHSEPSFASLTENNLEAAIEIFPNPNSGQFSIELKDGFENIQNIIIYDFSGKEVFFNTKKISSNQIEFTLNKGTQGLHIIKIESENNTISKKILIQ